jgi:hypothetical protein
MSHKKILKETAKAWSPIAATIVILTIIAYVLVQQNYRMSANDNQIQIAEEVSDAISKGTPPDSIVPPIGNTDISKSLAVFVMIYDDNGKILGSSAVLDEKNPTFPQAVLDEVKKTGKQARVTWQPKAGIRIASVVNYYKTADGKTSGLVIAGRSLREVEKRENQSLMLAGLGGLFALLVTFLMTWLYKKMEHSKTTESTEHHHSA